jgi:hypothetical protein
MGQEYLHSTQVWWEGQTYLVRIYYDPHRKPRGAYQAVTMFGPGDWIISDGVSPEEVVRKQQTILPVAILSRALLTTAGTVL